MTARCRRCPNGPSGRVVEARQLGAAVADQRRWRHDRGRVATRRDGQPADVGVIAVDSGRRGVAAALPNPAVAARAAMAAKRAGTRRWSPTASAAVESTPNDVDMLPDEASERKRQVQPQRRIERLLGLAGDGRARRAAGARSRW